MNRISLDEAAVLEKIAFSLIQESARLSDNSREFLCSIRLYKQKAGPHFDSVISLVKNNEEIVDKLDKIAISSLALSMKIRKFLCFESETIFFTN